MERVLRIYKKADAKLNRILIPKFIIDKYGREFFIDLMGDGTIMLTPITEELKEELIEKNKEKK